MCYQIATERLCGHVEVTHPSHCGGTLATCETILVEFRRPAKEERLCFKCDPPLAAWRANEVHWYGYLRPGRKIGQDLIQELHEDETIAKVEKIFSAQRKEARSSLVKYLERCINWLAWRRPHKKLSPERAREVELILRRDEEPRRKILISKARQRVMRKLLKGNRMVSGDIMSPSSVTEYDRRKFRSSQLGYPEWR